MTTFFKSIFSNPLLMEQAETYFFFYVKNIIFAGLIFLIGMVVSRILSKSLSYLLERRHVDRMVRVFIVRLFYISLLILVSIAALSQLGVQTASIVAVIGAAGLAVALSLKNYLANFASGILIITSRLFKHGDTVEIDGQQGEVEDIQLFFTNIRTSDNQVITVPNSSVVSTYITHYSKCPSRRIGIKIRIGYADSIDRAREVLMKIMQEDPAVLQQPAPEVFVEELGESSVNLLARCWVEPAEHFPIRCALNEKFKKAFDQAGITIPCPQREVHLINHS